MKPCSHCKYSLGERVCLHPMAIIRTDRVTGENVYEDIYLFRAYTCGKNVPVYFEPKLSIKIDEKVIQLGEKLEHMAKAVTSIFRRKL